MTPEEQQHAEMGWSPWGPVHLERAESAEDLGVSDSSSGEDETYLWEGNVLVRCRGYHKRPCANSALIRHGRWRCKLCTRYRAEAKTYEKATVSALWAVWKEAGGRMEPDPDSTLAEEFEPEDDNVIFQEGGESFTGTEAVNAAMNVALLLRDNGERGFEPLFDTEVEEEYGSRTLAYDVLWKALCRLAYIGDRDVLPCETIKAASVLGGVTAWPPIIRGKAGRSKIGYVRDSVCAAFVTRLCMENKQKLKEFATPGQVNQVNEFLRNSDDNERATVCNAALAAACAAHIKEKKLCSLDPGCLTWHHFRGGRWATGNFPTWQ